MNREDIGRRLREARENASLSRDSVVATPGVTVSRTTLQQWENGATEASLEILGILAELYKVTPQYIIFGEDEDMPSPSLPKDVGPSKLLDNEFVLIPAYNIAVSAGHGMFSEGAAKPDKYLAFRRQWVKARNLNPKCLAVLFPEGDSMVPTIPEQAAIVINRERNKALDGKVYVIRIDDRLYVKRTQWIPTGGLRLISDNKAYDSFDITKADMEASDVEICGQVIHASHDLPD